jgi:glycosyltransferase involved in cell wall biosynthesis
MSASGDPHGREPETAEVLRVDLVDPSAYTPPYDHALAAALARAGAQVRLLTSRFAYGSVPPPAQYTRLETFYRHVRGAPGSRLRLASKLAEQVPDMVRLRRMAREADIVHFQWLAVPNLDVHLLPDRPLVLTAHDLLPREPRTGQLRAQRRLLKRVDAVVVHSQYGRRTLVEGLGLPPEKVHVIHHGAFNHLAEQPAPRPLAPGLRQVDPRRPVVLCFGLIRPYKGLEVLLEAWHGFADAELWIVGRPRMDLGPLRARASDGVRFIPRFVSDEEVPALFRRADIVVLPYAQTERFDFSGVLATALAFGKPTLLTDIGGFGEVAATGAARVVPPGDPAALREALADLIGDPAAREQLAAAARQAARERYSWESAARKTLELYATIRHA